MPRTCQDPELPDDPEEKLYFVLVDLDYINSSEFRRATQLELKGKISEDQLAAFKEAGGVLDGKVGESGSTSAKLHEAKKLLSVPTAKAKANNRNKAEQNLKAVTNGEDGKRPKARTRVLYRGVHACMHA